MTVAELSLWHDVPLVAEGGSNFNFICEIPKCTRKKFEVATTEGATPIKQDEKKGVLREFKKGDIFFNYGCFPRTWEDPRHVSKDTGFPGDNDPLDVCALLRPARQHGVAAASRAERELRRVDGVPASGSWKRHRVDGVAAARENGGIVGSMAHTSQAKSACARSRRARSDRSRFWVSWR